MKFKSPPIHRTPRYRAKAAFVNMKRRCGDPSGANPSYVHVEVRMTLNAWMTWAIPRYERFDEEHPGERPSAARRGDQGHYEIGNIAIIPQIENRAQMPRPAQLQANGLKRCGRCREHKTAAEFCRGRYSPDGLHHHCRDCLAFYRNRSARKDRERKAMPGAAPSF